MLSRLRNAGHMIPHSISGHDRHSLLIIGPPELPFRLEERAIIQQVLISKATTKTIFGSLHLPIKMIQWATNILSERILLLDSSDLFLFLC